ncbi:septum site-determining protein [Streptomyces sp. ms191]|uniref:TadE/TadG family type IV pilus assembly protein n=1 Tax=unclassified Streptomyces TaxID=2593676 RepID=UPI0011CEB39C|nr:TadE/TadG family type IV pilus assembly protein [Streptomyces sp. ms191]TXS20826.1 septum site-determining protein [Streptomyces sp. ms191]
MTHDRGPGAGAASETAGGEPRTPGGPVRTPARQDRAPARRPRTPGGPARTRTPGGPARTRRSDRGQVAIEYLGFLPVLLLVALAGIQLGLAAYAAQQAGTGARAAARAATQDDSTLDPETAGRSAMSGWIADRSRVSVDPGTTEAVASVTVRIPSVVPFWTFGDVRKSATMPLTEEDAS